MIQLAELYRMQGQLDAAKKLFDRARSLSRSSLKEIPIFFGTDRNRDSGAKTPAFGNTRALRGMLTLAVARVTLPTLLRKTGEQRKAGLLAPEESTDVSRLAIQPLEINEEGPFVKSIGDVLMHSSIFREQTFIFIHGYNVSFENAVRRAAQIAY